MAMAEAMMPKTLPGGGLASFLTSNMDEIDDSVLAFGRPNGINSMRDVAERMAQMGRGGDNFVVHASEREMMVPREVVENNPQLRRQIMQSIAAEGADPNAYIVGNEANSINPMTGQREFFLKKLVRGIKNVVKKVAPIVLPIALNFLFPGMGAVAAGALGSGIGTLIQGGNVRDAFRSALIGGAAGGLYSGISGAMRGQGFMAGVREGLIGQPNMRFFELNPSVRSFFGGAPQAAAPTAAAPAPSSAPAPTPAPAAADAPRTLGQRVQDFIMPKPAMTTAQLAQEAGRIAAANPGLDPNTIYESLVSSQPSAMARFAKPALLAGGAAALAGAFNPVEQEAPPTPGYDTNVFKSFWRQIQSCIALAARAPRRLFLSATLRFLQATQALCPLWHQFIRPRSTCARLRLSRSGLQQWAARWNLSPAAWALSLVPARKPPTPFRRCCRTANL
jgi:hypothetical protein